MHLNQTNNPTNIQPKKNFKSFVDVIWLSFPMTPLYLICGWNLSTIPPKFSISRFILNYNECCKKLYSLFFKHSSQ